MPISKQNQNPPAVSGSSLPLLPRRAFLAAVLSGLLAASGTAVIWLGLLEAPQRATFQFSRGTAFASGEEMRLQSFLAKALQDDRIMVVILGHTGQQGAPDANLDLSQARAAAAAKIGTDLGISNSQMTVRGLAGSAPTARTEGQTERAYQASLSRVEVTLQVRK